MFYTWVPSSGQDFILGVKYGYGTHSFIRQSDDKKTPSYTTQKIGLVTEFSPYYSHLFIISGIAYEINDLGNSISVPLTARIVLGNTVRPFFEGGGYFNYFLADSSGVYSLKNDLGANLMAGILVHIKKHVRIELGYTYRFGLTTALGEEIMLPGGQDMQEEYRRKSGSIDFCIKYRF